MNTNWERVQNLFLETLDRRPEERTAFLDTACADDEVLRREVELLIAHADTGEHVISDAVRATAKSLFESDDMTGVRLGPWRVLREIGRGGMGSVYLAARDDDEFQKRVAIKVVKGGMDTAEVLKRFRRERQILAHLDHPYIARLIDGGSTSHGRPFLVMEYVEGRTIDAYCREAELDVEARCRLFLKVCTAVSYAHRNLVIHRDLKPGNILVAADGSPKLLDFGVAKLLDAEPGSGPTQTIGGSRLLTPDYASPEQVRGDVVGTASDVYALGAILYEVLTGVKAHHVDSHSPAELEKAICNTEIQLPSSCVSASDARLRRQISGDLDNIILTAMRKEPGLRYSSVDLLAQDISRHLEGRSVTARAPSLSYRFGKFVRRNRIWLAAACLVTVSLVGGTLASIAAARQARIERRRAEDRLSQTVELVNHALFNVDDRISRLPGATDARRQMVKSTLDYLDKVSKDAGNDERLSKEMGSAYLRLGDLQGYPYSPNLGDTAGAMKSYRTSATILDPLRRTHPNDAEAQRLWGETQYHLAQLLNQTGDLEGASKLIQSALPTVEALARLPDAGVEGETTQGNFYDLLANITLQHDLTLALVYARRDVEIFGRLAERYPDHSDLVLDESDGYSLVGQILNFQGNSRGAIEQFLRSAALRESLVRAHPNDVVYKRNLMLTYGHIGDLLGSPVMNSLGDSAGARVYYRKAVAIGEKIQRADLRDATAKYDLGAGLGRLGMVDVPASEVPESLATLGRSATILEQIVADDPNSIPRKLMLALVLEYAGHRLRSLGRYPDAIARYRRSVVLSDSMLAADPMNRPARSQVMASSRGIATAMAMAGNRAGSLRQIQSTIARAQAAVDEGKDTRSRQRHLEECTIELGSIYEILAKQPPASRQLHDWEAARTALRHAISLLDAMAAASKLFPIEATDLQNAQKLLALAEEHSSSPQQSSR